MHQPLYVDPASQTAMMPWVRLHCVKGYLDMIAVLEEFPRIRANFNLSPVLVMQIRDLAQERIQDEWLELSRMPASELDEGQRLMLLEHFFKAHWDHMVRPHARYWELLNKRGLTFYRDDVRRGVRYFSSQEMVDLQVWFNLAWCGFTICRQYPELAELKRKGRGFTEAEKMRVLDVHMEAVQSILGRYRAAEERGQVELMTTPFFHPILPLVVDSTTAERAMPGRAMPNRFAWPEDARVQVTAAVEQHAAVFGRVPRGVWPAEGAIAPEVLPLFARSGLEYFASDEEVLFASTKRDPAWRGAAVDHLELFQAWRVECDGASMGAFFRERPLSDYIGFHAAKSEPAQAAMHLLFHFRHIAELTRDRGLIPLILDGENAWENFRDGGEAFLRALYAGMEGDSARLRSTTLEDYLHGHPPQRRLATVHSGSWIHANYDIWIGESEENRAWNLLGETRAWLDKRLKEGGLKRAQIAEARKAVYAAEGSDWFWWYGPDFSTENDAIFDRLFRAHLRAVYRACGAVPPAALEVPLPRHARGTVADLPTRFITPGITGTQAGFFEWAGSGRYRARTETETPRLGDECLSEVLFGNDDRFLYLHVELVARASVEIVVRFLEPTGIEVRGGGVSMSGPARIATADGARSAGLFAFAELAQFAIPLDALGRTAGDTVALQILVLVDGVEAEVHPHGAPIEFQLLSEDWALAHWMV